MTAVRDRLESHRTDVLVLLEELSRTAQTYSSFRLAGAVSHLAQAQALLAEDLAGLSGGSNETEDLKNEEPIPMRDPAFRFVKGGPAGAAEDPTPINGIRLEKEDPSEPRR